MTRDEIKKLLDESKKVLEQDHSNSEKTIKNELNAFKKKTLDRI